MNPVNSSKIYGALLIAALFCITQSIYGQNDILESKINLNKQEYELKSILNLLFDEYSVNFSYNEKDLPLAKVIHFSHKQQNLKSVLDEISRQTVLDYALRDEIIIIKKPLKKYTVSGNITDTNSGETLPYANIVVTDKQLGTVSNKFGFYSITLTEGTYTLTFNYVGYNVIQKTIELTGNITVNIDLLPKTETLEEVIIKPEQNDILNSEKRLVTLDIQKIKEIPASLGEADVLRYCQSMPSVVSVGEAGGGYFVRGGAWDQNLMLLDEAVVYNGAHIEGFFSVFNPDILKDVKFYKEGIPAKYGGRISSIMDITQKEGNMKSYHFSAGVGLIASKLMIEGPIIKDKASFVLAGRRSYMDIFFKYLPDEDIKDSKYYFYDINSRLNFILNPKNRLYFSLYSGDDHLKDNTYDQRYGNLTTTFRWNHLFGSRLFSNTSLIYSDYVMQDRDPGSDWSWKNTVGIDHYEFKDNFSWYLASHKIDFGVDMQYVSFHPGHREPLSDSSLSVNIKIPDQQSLESAIYIDDCIKLTPRLEFFMGLRLSYFMNLGPEDIFVYDQDSPKDETSITDTIHYRNNQAIKTYAYPEPRFSLKCNLSDNQALKLTYDRTVQYIHRITENYMALPTDMYKPSNKYVKPVLCDQVSLGYFTALKDHLFDLSVEIYYKKIQHVTEVKPGSDIYLNSTLDADILQGDGKAYGIETMLSKTNGIFTGTVSYTYSRSFKKIESEYKQENLNFGKFYPAHYDIPHQFKLIAQYKLNDKWSFHADFLYLTGRPVSLPDGQYIYAETLIPYYSGINNHRLPDFHRLNIGATRYSVSKPGRKWRGYLNFSLYNLYARKNAYSIYIRRKPMTRNTEAVNFTIIETIVPTLSYNIEF